MKKSQNVGIKSAFTPSFIGLKARLTFDFCFFFIFNFVLEVP